MKNLFRHTAVLLFALPVEASAADVVNGWSAKAPISKIFSEGSRTLLKLNGISSSCGHPDLWSLPLEESARSKAKLGMLLLAYSMNKQVTLRCENSQVTDFDVSE